MKILITGGAGFIGSAVIHHTITNTTNTVLNVDKLTCAGNLVSLATVADSPSSNIISLYTLLEAAKYYYETLIDD